MEATVLLQSSIKLSQYVEMMPFGIHIRPYEVFPVNGNIVCVALLKEGPLGNRDAITRYEKRTVTEL